MTQRTLAASRASNVSLSQSDFLPIQRGPLPGPRSGHLELMQERHQLMFLLAGQSRFQYQIEEFDRITQGQQPAVVEVRGRLLDSA